MERAATASMRRCLRNGKGSTGVLRCTAPVSARNVCIAATICPARKTSSFSRTLPTPKYNTNTLRPNTTSLISLRRDYSSESSVQGTIGVRQAGIPQEAERVKEALTAPEHLNEKERQIWDLLNKELECSSLEVQDISGGCGSMYGIDIVSEKFRGLNMLKQQRLVNGVLGEEIKGWHGVQLKTRAP